MNYTAQIHSYNFCYNYFYETLSDCLIVTQLSLPKEFSLVCSEMREERGTSCSMFSSSVWDITKGRAKYSEEQNEEGQTQFRDKTV